MLCARNVSSAAKLRKQLIAEASTDLLLAAKSAYKLMDDANVDSLDPESGCRFSAVKWQLMVAIRKAEGR